MTLARRSRVTARGPHWAQEAAPGRVWAPPSPPVQPPGPLTLVPLGRHSPALGAFPDGLSAWLVLPMPVSCLPHPLSLYLLSLFYFPLESHHQLIRCVFSVHPCIPPVPELEQKVSRVRRFLSLSLCVPGAALIVPVTSGPPGGT